MGSQDATKEKVMAAISKLESSAETTIESNGVPGLAIAVVYQDVVVYLKGFGVREVGKDDLVDADTVFQLASCSKAIAATIVAAIVQDGKTVTWDTRIADVDPEFRLHDAYPTAELTIRDLFAHRSGLPGDAGNDLENLGFGREEILHRLRYLKPESSFRSAYSYSNFGITEGAVAAAKAAGLAWEDAAEERLYQPLGMTSTSSRYSDFVKRTNRASLHVMSAGKWQGLVKRDPDAQSPAGGVSSSARDLAQWIRLELGNGKFEGKELIKEGAIKETHLPIIMSGHHPITHDAIFYGLGWGIEYGPHGVVWGHAGAFTMGARTLVDLIPSQQLGIVVLSNAFPTGVPEGLANDFFDIVFDGKPSRDWTTDWNKYFDSLVWPAREALVAKYGTLPVSRSPALPSSAYAGTYINNYLGTVQVIEEGGRLTLRLGPDGKKNYSLKHFDRDIFTYTPVPETPDVPMPLAFTIGPDEKASVLTLEAMNGMGQGVLTRVMD
jgi:CubicO group peptidase (beta-lactamase class C family)